MLQKLKEDERGQVKNTIMTIGVAGIVLVITMFVIGGVTEGLAMEQDAAYSMEDSVFGENLENTDSPWMVTDSGQATTTWDSTNEWAKVGASESGTGTSLIEQAADVDEFNSVESATIHAEYQVKDATDLTQENIIVLLKDPSGNENVIYVDSNLTSTKNWTEVDNDVASYVDESGSYTLELKAELDATGTSVESNFDNANLAIRVKEPGEQQNMIVQMTQSIYDALTMAPIIFIVLIAGLVISVLMKWTNRGSSRR